MEYQLDEKVVYVQDDVVHVGTIYSIDHTTRLIVINETQHIIHERHIFPNAQIHIGGA